MGVFLTKGRRSSPSAKTTRSSSTPTSNNKSVTSTKSTSFKVSKSRGIKTGCSACGRK